MGMYKKITVIVDFDLSKLALVKQSLVGGDRQATHHMDKIGDILDFIKKKYCKEDLVLGILANQINELREPKNIKHSLENIDKFIVTLSHLTEWGLQRHINSKTRSELVPILFCAGTRRWKFIKQMQIYEEK